MARPFIDHAAVGDRWTSLGMLFVLEASMVLVDDESQRADMGEIPGITCPSCGLDLMSTPSTAPLSEFGRRVGAAALARAGIRCSA